MSDSTITRDMVVKFLKKRKLHPSVPEVIVTIINITRSPTASVNDLVKVIEQDPGLTKRILNVGNSGFYGIEREIRSISEAVVLMGWNTIKMISIGATILKMINDRNPRLYTHVMRTAQYAKFIAGEANFYKADEIAIVGLLHDLGLIILQEYFNKDFLKTKQYAINNGVPIHVAERTLLGVTHAEIGGWTVEEWKMPENIIEAITLHHEFDPETYHARKTAVIHVADSLAIAADYYGPAWEKVPEIVPSSLKTLGFAQKEFRRIALAAMKKKYDPLVM
ncbi:MAG: HDOD domain-containing protein [Candidatus Latescibacteria bacterium]|nr:HDOD domain-containing protein [Candidatus Latescibacterota bacterium]